MEAITKRSINDIEAIRISIASAEKISKLAHGEVRKPDTINYRTGKPERDGLFCAKIFGPVNDFECLCGKYKGPRYRGHTCERCGVEVTTRRTRRERLGKITLVYPVVHIWFLKVPPNPISTILDISVKDIEDITNFSGWVIVQPPEKIAKFSLKDEQKEEMIQELKNQVNIRDVDFNKRYSRHIDQIMKIDVLLKHMAIRRKIIDVLFDKEILQKKSLELLCKKVLSSISEFKDVKEVDDITRYLQSVLQKLDSSSDSEKLFEEKRKELILNAIKFTEYLIVEREIIGLLIKFFPEIFSPITLIGGLGGDSIRAFDDKNIVVEKESFGKDQFAFVISKKGAGIKEKVPQNFIVGSGAETIRYILKNLNFSVLLETVKAEISAVQEKEGADDTKSSSFVKLSRRLRVISGFISNAESSKPEDMIFEVIPVLPPELRPIVQLEGGRIARSDLNEFYRMIIQRNIRLGKIKKLLEIGIGVPDSVIENEIRLLQNAVDSLIDSSKTKKQATSRTGMTLRSLADIIKGKYGRFRQNLLGKRTDFSARSVIVVGPDLKLHQIAVPKEIALELFKPFILWWLIDKRIVTSVKEARKLFDEKKYIALSGKDDEYAKYLFQALEDVIKEKLILANRAPTLHRMNVQAFEVVLTEGKAIRLHPLVCTAYNADFDGDQMGLFLPLSIHSQTEARVLMLSTHQILSPAHGGPIVYPTQDQVMGIFWMTVDFPGKKGEGKLFSSAREVFMAYVNGEVDLQSRIKCLITCQCSKCQGKEKIYSTTPGRVIFYHDILPKKLCFELVNKPLGKKEIIELISVSRMEAGEKDTVILLDRMKDMGFEMLTRSGFTLGIHHFKIPAKKEQLIKEASEIVKSIEEKYARRLITWGERYNRITQIWLEYTERIGKAVREELSYEDYDVNGKTERWYSKNPAFLMVHSGSRGSYEQMKQINGVRGIVAKPTGELIEFPILSNLREGLSPLEYFISTHGGRKGLADTALKTAKAGYLTRKLVDAAQDVIVKQEDCGTKKSIEMKALAHGGEILRSLWQRIFGRTAAEDITSPETGEIIVKKGEIIDKNKAKLIEELGRESVRIRSPLTCDLEDGVCQKCYGWDLSMWQPVTIGEAVGIIAAESIGEPGTQLTMRTFHYGGIGAISERGDIIVSHDGIVKFEGVKYVEIKISKDEMEKINVDKSDLIEGSKILRVISRAGYLNIVSEKGRTLERYELKYGAAILRREGDKVKAGQKVAVWNPYANIILTHASGIVRFQDIVPGVTVIEKTEETTGKIVRTIIEPIAASVSLRPSIVVEKEDKTRVVYPLPVRATISVEEGEYVRAGDEIARVELGYAKTKDITTGLPKAEEFFEARTPKDTAVVSEITGRVVKIEYLKGGKKKVVIKPEGRGATKLPEKEYTVPKNRHVIVVQGDIVQAGEAITDGTPDPKSLLRIRGVDYASMFLLNEIQRIYSSQGIDINDKHFEIIIRQMTRRVRIKDPGDTSFVTGEIVDRFVLKRINDELIAQGKRPAAYEYIILGVTRAALYSDSWIAAASFQETPKVLVMSAIEGKIDYFKGIKENIIVGKLIPSGTTFPRYRNTSIEIQKTEPTEEIIEEEINKEY
ncbi:MAG: DNA-directed RNA polymerase subunit beta' [Candidatus Calescibacterium sp.]|nr:DNA-directed RNA polymerase subunit beta' [Candidatus Calescibacterium sp.]MDW8087018.1 DNA-directed RNA polymerase subunit beta' [Candidatus Calescibacterium sp.]